MDLTEHIVEKASYLAKFLHAAMTLFAIFVIYAIVIVAIVAIFIFLSVMATIIILMPIVIVALMIIVVTELIGYFWRVAPGGDGLVINLYAGVAQGDDAAAAQPPGGTSNGRGDADNGRGWLRWWLGWWWCGLIVAVAAFFLVTEPVSV